MRLKLPITRGEMLRDANGLGFVALNVLDAWLTRLALEMGSSELNPVMLTLGNHLETKVLASIAVVMVLWVLKRDRLLLPLNIGMGLVVAWNLAVVIIGSTYG